MSFTACSFGYFHFYVDLFSPGLYFFSPWVDFAVFHCGQQDRILQPTFYLQQMFQVCDVSHFQFCLGSHFS